PEARSLADGGEGPPRALAPGSRLTDLTDADRTAVRQLAERAAPEGGPLVREMGLVGESDSMARLHLVMNDPGLDAPVRQAIADTVLAATREHMIAAGRLAPDEPLMLLFHGAPTGRSASLREHGAQLTRIGGGSQDDFGRGLYLTSRVESADVYAAKFGVARGEIFPFVLRGRDLGTVVDVAPGGVHRSEWESFVMGNTHLYDTTIAMPGARLDLEAFLAGRQPFGTVDAFGNRGIVFEAFLAHLAATTGDPRLAAPDAVLGELGGPMTSGVGGRGDQQAIRSQAALDEMNRQMGLRAREPGSEDAGAPPPSRPGGDEPEAPARAPRADDEVPDKLEARSINEDDALEVEAPAADVDEDPLAHLRQLDVSISPEQRIDLAQRVQAAADLLPPGHPMQEALQDIARGLPRADPKEEGRNPVRRLIALLRDHLHGDTIRRLIVEGPPPDEATAAERRREERWALSAKRGQGEAEQVVGDLPEQRLMELLAMPGIEEGGPPSTSARQREVEITPEYSVLLTDAPVIPSDAQGGIDPDVGRRMADAYRRMLGFSSDRNVAIAEVRVGDSSQVLATKSNRQQYPGLTHLPDAPEFNPFAHNGLPREHDTERILLEHIARQIRDSGMPVSDYSRITIRMYTERAPCPSCSHVIQQFLNRFPGVSVIVTTSDI
ncbi:MAG: deaminase domain-containing protein, partial [Allosphingosinicella sp.]